jgi:hypothetical protein
VKQNEHLLDVVLESTHFKKKMKKRMGEKMSTGWLSSGIRA